MRKTRVLSAIITVILALQCFVSVTAAKSDNPFRVRAPSYTNLYISYPSQMTLAQSGGDGNSDIADTVRFMCMQTPYDTALFKAINALPALSEVKTPSKDKATANFITENTGSSYIKHIYALKPTELVYDGKSYKLTAAQYDSLKSAYDVCAKSAKQEGFMRPQWLVWMNIDRVANVSYKVDGKVIQRDPYTFSNVPNSARNLFVESGSFKKYSGTKVGAFNNAVEFRFDFINGVYYNVIAADDKLYVESSDKDYGCQYTLKDAENTISQMKTTWLQDYNYGDDLGEMPDDEPDWDFPVAPPITGKPVIYLYPEKTRDVSVKLGFKGELCYTYPEYNDGWNVTASPDGTLINKADDSTHYYLFWDGNPDFKNWDMSEGFVIKGSETQRFFEQTMPKLGLTPREYNDFITYWTPLLAGNAYNLISFSTEQYEDVAPLDISPAPDTVLRVHMLYKPLKAPVEVEAQTLPKAPERLGFTVVEWGATRVK